MRAKEFIVNVNVPITIKINGDGDPEVDMDGLPDPDSKPAAMVTPQQQEIELQKAALGKKTIVAAQLLEPPEADEIA